ncbi:MAG: (d)CMP kinase [candidate division Zixibacteria bacterium]
MKKHRVIAIDGPAGSGKSSTARLLAARLGFTYLDTGAMYRSVTLAAMEEKIDLKDEASITDIAGKVKIEIVPGENEDRIFLDGKDATLLIRETRIDAGVSLVSSYKEVREKMVELQRRYAQKADVVAEGRDMGTVVFPDADLKIFLVADLQTRAIRRHRQLDGVGITTSIEEQTASLSSRDLFDSGRDHSPLIKAEDAIEINTTDMTLKGQVEKAYELACEKLGIS